MGCCPLVERNANKSGGRFGTRVVERERNGFVVGELFWFCFWFSVLVLPAAAFVWGVAG